MIIITDVGDNLHLKKDRDDLLTKIASYIINFCTGRCIFNKKGVIDRPNDDFHTFEYKDVTYHIKGCSINVDIIVGHNDLFSDMIKYHLKRKLCALMYRYDNIIKSDDPKNIMVLDHYSSDFTLEERNVSSVWANINTSHIQQHRNYINFIINVLKHPTFKHSLSGSRDAMEYTCIIEQHSTIIVDLAGIFNLPDLTEIFRLPTLKDMKVYRKFIDPEFMVIYDKYHDTIYPSIQHIYGAYPGEMKNYSVLCVQIYEEIWAEEKTIFPMMVEKESDVYKGITLNNIFKYLKIPYNYNKEEKEEKKNMGVKRRKDICHGCHVPLYDDIYVLEYKHNKYQKVNHICLCPYCTHIKYYEELNAHQNSVTLLRVKYPRSYTDVVNESPASDSTKELLLHVKNARYDPFTGMLKCGSYVGVTSIQEVYSNRLHKTDYSLFYYTY
jgi:hypothetical protein